MPKVKLEHNMVKSVPFADITRRWSGERERENKNGRGTSTVSLRDVIKIKSTPLGSWTFH